MCVCVCVCVCVCACVCVYKSPIIDIEQYNNTATFNPPLTHRVSYHVIVGRVFAIGPENLGSIPDRVISKI